MNRKSVKNFDARSLSNDDRKTLLEKLKKLDYLIGNEIEFNKEVENEEIKDDIEVKSEVKTFAKVFFP